MNKYFLSVSLIIGSVLHAQISIEDVFRKADLNPQSLKQLQWIPGTSSYCWVAKQANRFAL
jgi:hypothetical protein